MVVGVFVAVGVLMVAPFSVDGVVMVVVLLSVIELVVVPLVVELSYLL